MLRIESLLVEPVADLVQNAKEAVAEIAQAIAGRNAAIAGPDTAEKRVGRRVESAPLEVEADCGGRQFAQGALAVDGKLAEQDRNVRPARRGQPIASSRGIRS